MSDLDSVARYLEESHPEVDIVVEPNLAAGSASVLLRWLAPSATGSEFDLSCDIDEQFSVESRASDGTRPVRLNVSNVSAAQSRRPVEVRPPLGLCALRSEAAFRGESRANIADFFEDRPIVVLVAPWHEPWTGDLKALAEEKAWLVERLEFGALPQTLPERLHAKPWPELIALSRSQVATLSVAAAVKVFGAILTEETRGLRVRQAMVQQRVALVQKSSVPNGNEILTQIRSRLQRQFGDFERTISDRLSHLLSPASSTIWGRVEDRLAELDSLEWSDRATGTRVQIPVSFDATLTDDVLLPLRQQAEDDIAALHELMDTQVDAVRKLIPHDAPRLTLQQREMSVAVFERLLSRIRFDRVYRGDLPRPGLDEYLNVIRRNYIVLSLLSFLGVSSLFSKIHGPARIGLIAAFVPIAAFLLRRSVVKARKQSVEREVDRARELLRTELRRTFTEIERAWPLIIADYIREHFSAWSSEVDMLLRDHVRHVTESVSEEKVRVQRQLHTIETNNRQLQSASKRREAMENASAKMRVELRQIFDGISRRMQKETA
jgi:hypothetical protein